MWALVGCGAGLDLDGAIQRGQVRWYRACGLWPMPTSWRLVYGHIQCADAARAYGCHRRHPDGTTSIVVSTDVGDQATLDQVAVHELGHELGAAHVGPGKGVMAARISEARAHISAWDLDAVAICPTRRW